MDNTTLLSIKEFSKFTGVSQSTLRYYDEIGLISPISRGENNYRYYVPFQIILLNYINVLIDLGVPLSTIKDMNKCRTPDNVIDLLSRQEGKLDHQMHELRTAYSIIHIFRKNIQNGLTAAAGEVAVKEMGGTRYILGPKADFTNTKSFYKPFIDFCNSATEYRINLRYPIGGYHDSMANFLKAPGQPDRFFSLDPLGNCAGKEGKYLVGYRRGYYGEFGDVPQKMAAYAEEHNLAFSGPVFVLYLLDEISMIEPEEYLSRITVGVTKRK